MCSPYLGRIGVGFVLPGMLTLGGLRLLAQQTSPEVPTLIRFTHPIHLSQGIPCEHCHASVFESRWSGDNNLPGKEACQGCHDTEGLESCGVCHVNPENEGAFRNPDRTFHFNHQTHLAIEDLPEILKTALGKTGYPHSDAGDFARLIDLNNHCTGCHRGLESAASEGPGSLPRMADCLVCHQAEGDALRTCATCHTGSDLLPHTHRTENFYDDHSSEGFLFNAAECRQCHTPGYNPCSQCH